MMAKRDKIPPAQRSPWGKKEKKMGGEKKSPVKCEQAVDVTQGCGVPGCPICLPSEGRMRADVRFDSFSEEKRLSEELRALMFGRRGGIFSMMPTFTGIDIAEPEPARDPVHDRLVAEERRTREPVKKYLLTTELNVDWRDIAGNEEAHRAMIEAIEFPIKHKKLFAHYGKKMTKGILLSGPPGCGKTMFGKAAATVIGQLYGKTAALLAVNATALQTPYVGQTEEIIRNLFAYAKAYKALHGHQLVLFIDEADAILPSRNGMRRAVASWEESNVATFLAEMDGLEESGALVILATNRPEAIDQAVLRDGRIDRKVVVKRPTLEAARIIMKKALFNIPIAGPPFESDLAELAIDELFSPLRHILKVKTEKGVDYLTLAHCVSGAMIVGLVERAKAHAFHRDIAAGTMTGIHEGDIMAAVENIMKEQVELPDIYALTELAQRLNASVLELDRVQQPEFKYTGTLQ